MAKKGEKSGSAYGPTQEFGRPAKYDNPADLIEAVLDYFQYSRTNDEPLTITGLVLHLGFASRSSLDDYEKRSDDFSYIIKKAKTIVENGYEKRLHSEDASPTGAIFALKNMGWKDRSEADVNMNGQITGFALG